MYISVFISDFTNRNKFRELYLNRGVFQIAEILRQSDARFLE